MATAKTTIQFHAAAYNGGDKVGLHLFEATVTVQVSPIAGESRERWERQGRPYISADPATDPERLAEIIADRFVSRDLGLKHSFVGAELGIPLSPESQRLIEVFFGGGPDPQVP